MHILCSRLVLSFCWSVFRFLSIVDIFFFHLCLMNANCQLLGPVNKVQFKFRRLEIPPNYSTDHIGNLLFIYLLFTWMVKQKKKRIMSYSICLWNSIGDCKLHTFPSSVTYRNYRLDFFPGCIGGCDDILRQLIQICGTGSRTIPNVAGLF